MYGQVTDNKRIRVYQVYGAISEKMEIYGLVVVYFLFLTNF